MHNPGMVFSIVENDPRWGFLPQLKINEVLLVPDILDFCSLLLRSLISGTPLRLLKGQAVVDLIIQSAPTGLRRIFIGWLNLPTLSCSIRKPYTGDNH